MSSNDAGEIGGNIDGVSYARILFLLKKNTHKKGSYTLIKGRTYAYTVIITSVCKLYYVSKAAPTAV